MADEHFADGVGPVPTIPLYQGGAGPDRDAIVTRISELKPLDEEGARAIVADVVKAGFSDLAVERLIKPLAEALGVNIPAAKKFWKDAASAAREAAAAQTVKASDEQRARIEQEVRRAASGARRRASTIGCGPRAGQIAESPTLLADMEEAGARARRGWRGRINSRRLSRRLEPPLPPERIVPVAARRAGRGQEFSRLQDARADSGRRRHPYVERQLAQPGLLRRRRRRRVQAQGDLYPRSRRSRRAQRGREPAHLHAAHSDQRRPARPSRRHDAGERAAGQHAHQTQWPGGRDRHHRPRQRRG